VHLLAAVPNRSYLEAHGFGLDRFIREPLRIEAGLAIAPDRPGHGVEFDWTALDTLRVASPALFVKECRRGGRVPPAEMGVRVHE
jgi:L-alanine-DL-glutamate epimerase-like enolase superfamily enzyme